jgi:hypothetical protein
MSVHVDEVQTHVRPSSAPREEPVDDGEQRPGAAAAAWAEHNRMAHRDGCRTAARDFDD